MLPKLALRVCPEPGCPKIGAARCPDHGVDMIREVYVRNTVARATADTLRKVEDLASNIHRHFGGP